MNDEKKLSRPVFPKKKLKDVFGVYFGEVDKRQNRCGVGVNISPTGTKYEGNEKHFKIIFVWASLINFIISGGWKDNKKHGRGFLTCRDGSFYQG